MSSGPVDNHSVGGDVRLPFACRHEDGSGRADVVLKPRAIQCALSRICGVCAQPLTRPIAFVGSSVEVSFAEFWFPPVHEPCGRQLVEAGRASAVVLTAGFDLLRPSTRGAPVSFRANSVIESAAGGPA